MRYFLFFIACLFFILNCYSETLITLTPDNMVLLRGEVTSENINKVQKDLLDISNKLNKNDIIYLVIDSEGGSVYSGIDMINTFQLIPQKIHTITIFAASMAFMISQHGDKRFINKKGIMMGHRASGGFSGQFEMGEVESQLNLWKQIVRDMEQDVSKRMGISLKVYKEKIQNEMWLYDKNAVKENAADDLVIIKCSKELLQEKRQ